MTTRKFITNMYFVKIYNLTFMFFITGNIHYSATLDHPELTSIVEKCQNFCQSSGTNLSSNDINTEIESFMKVKY